MLSSYISTLSDFRIASPAFFCICLINLFYLSESHSASLVAQMGKNLPQGINLTILLSF